MKSILLAALLLLGVVSGQEQIVRVGTNVSLDPDVRIQAVRGNSVIQCSLHPELARPFSEGVKKVEIKVQARTLGGGFMTTSRFYSSDDSKHPPLEITFSDNSPAGDITVKIIYYDGFRLWNGEEQDLAKLCEGRDLPLKF
ncbi:MAG: hypothetical protein KDN18_22970 [Verrucomicrobiae bacterium]|nr:hypothetical protein [Verrucomicrobiae bacterium]